MNKFLIALVIVASCFVAFLLFCVTTSSVENDEYGVFVKKPLLFGEAGVESTALTTGTYFHVRTSYLKIFKKTPITVPVNFQDLATGDNNLLDFESSITYIIDDPVKMASFDKNWFENNLQKQYSNIVRRIVMRESFTEILSDAEVNLRIDQKVTEELKALVKEYGLAIKIVDVSLGKGTPNPEVVVQMNLTAAEQQRQKTLTQREQSEILREKSEIARAAADKAYREKMGMTVAELVDFQKAQLMAEACKVSKSCIVVSGNTPPMVLPAQ